MTKGSAELGVSPAQATIAWTLQNPAVTSPILGVRTFPQLEDNLAALNVVFTDTQLVALDEVNAVELGFPHDFLALPMTRQVMYGGATIQSR